jgi:hypothetical protein
MTSYRNSQMISTDAVLKAADPVYDALTKTYGRVKRLSPTASDAEAGHLMAGKTEDRSAVQAALNSEVEHAIRQLRKAIRGDLGVSDLTRISANE